MYKTTRSALSAVKRAHAVFQALPLDKRRELHDDTLPARRDVIAACDRARDTFERDGWPDNWAAIQRAADDVAPGARYY